MAVSVAVCEIFSFTEWRDLENQVRVRSRKLEMAPFDRSHTSSYSPSIVTKALSCIVCEIQRLIGKKIAKCLYQTCIYRPRPRREWPPRNFVKMFDADKSRMIGLPYDEKLWQYVKPFSSNPGTPQTAGQTDRQKDLLYQYRASLCRRAIKMLKYSLISSDLSEFLQYVQLCLLYVVQSYLVLSLSVKKITNCTYFNEGKRPYD